MTSLSWFGIAFCISQSAMFSGLNLAFFSTSKLRLEVEATKGNSSATKILAMRRDANFLLTTILWGNVGINVLLTLLAESVMAGVVAFLFSTVVITFIGEIIPQAYFSRHAIKTAALLSPILRVYQVLLYPVAKPVAWVLKRWLGDEAIQYFQEKDLQEVIRMHVGVPETDIDRAEAKGAINFMNLDDVLIENAGEPLDPASVIHLDFEDGLPMFPRVERSAADPFLQKLQRSGKKWVVAVDRAGEPRMVIDSDGLIRDALFGSQPFNPNAHCHRPVVVRKKGANLLTVVRRLRVNPSHPGDDVIDEDIILYWGESRRVIAGADILGRLLRGIVRSENAECPKLGEGNAATC